MLMAFKILTMLWPFVRELLFGQKTPRQIVREHKIMVVVVAFLAASLVMNVFITQRLVAISHDYIALQKKYKALEGSRQHPVTPSNNQPVAMVEQRIDVASVPPPPPRTTKKPVPVTAPEESVSDRYHRLHRAFQEIEAQEHRTTSDN